MSSQPGSPLPSPTAPSIPDFELLRQIGRGSYGDVWLARSVTGIFRAIKIVWRQRFPDAEPFEREFRGLKEFAAISLGESTQMALLHVGRNEAAGFFYYVMELADDAERGRAIDPTNYVALTLAETRRRRGRLPAEECVQFGVELARSLAGLHRRGLVHRDIKPSNLILVNGVPKLADIGLVAPASSAQTYVGTEGYVPPEGPGSPGADVFALGKVLYELATGLDRQTFPKLPPELRALPDCRALLALNEVILRACEPQPDKRYRDAAALLGDLERLQGGRPVRRFARWQLVAAAAVLAVGSAGFSLWWSLKSIPPSIAVLPFTNMSADKENAYFADGVHEDVLTNLVSLRALKVISRTSMLQYRDTKKPTSQIARELGVTYILEGSVRRDGNSVRVSGQLIKAATDEHVWANTYDREVSDIFAVQADLAREITGALRVTLSPAENSRLDSSPTTNLAAYDLLKQAKAIEARGTNLRDQRELVLPLLKRAVDLDPNYAEAWAMLSSVHAGLYALSGRRDEQLKSAQLALARADLLAPDAYPTLLAGATLGAVTEDREAVNARRRRIVELFPDRPESHIASALTASFEKKWADALASYRAAARLDPRNAAMLHGYVDLLRKVRRYDEAESVGRLLLEIEPENLRTRVGVAEIPLLRIGSTAQLEKLLGELPAGKTNDTNVIIVRCRSALMMGRCGELVELWRLLGERFQWDANLEDSAKLFMVAVSLMALGDETSARPLLEELRDLVERRLETDPRNFAHVNRLGFAQAMLGERAAAVATLARARALMDENPNARGAPLVRWENAAYRIWAGESTEAIAEFARLLRDPANAPPWGNVHRLRRLCLFQPLRDDPRFEALLNDPKNNAPLF